MGTGRLVWVLTLDTEPGSAADLAPAYEVHFPFQASTLPPLMREFNKASLEAGLGETRPCASVLRLLRREGERQICL